MSSFYLEFRDPLFSIIILFAIIFVISFFSYWWGRYKTKDNHKYLDRFLEQFRSPLDDEDIKEIIAKSNLSQKSWLMLASSYVKNGDFEKAIAIYSELLRSDYEAQNTKEIMFLLGKTYFKAGFLGRSRDVFLEILRNYPRTPQALHYLLLVYEHMRDYQAALEVLEPLDILEEDISKESFYLRILSLINAQDIDTELKKQEIVFLYQEHKALERMVFEYLFRVDTPLAWKHIPLECVEKLADILWQLPKEAVDFDIISKNKFLTQLYSAKGYLDTKVRSDLFELDVLIHLDPEVKADINFEYICTKCKVVFPFGFHRCSSCHSIDTVELEYNLIKGFDKGFYEARDSFL
jgi:pentatricopeptide repeat protein